MVRVILRGENVDFADIKLGDQRFEISRNTLSLMVPAGWTSMRWRVDRGVPYRKAPSCSIQPGYIYEVTIAQDELQMDPCHSRRAR